MSLASSNLFCTVPLLFIITAVTSTEITGQESSLLEVDDESSCNSGVAVEGLSLLQKQATKATLNHKAADKEDLDAFQASLDAQRQQLHTLQASVEQARSQVHEAVATAQGQPVAETPPPVVPAPFNAPAPPPASLIDWWQPGQEWIWQLFAKNAKVNGVDWLNMPAPAPPPAPYSVHPINTPPPELSPITSNSDLYQEWHKGSQAWRDCKVSDWIEWSCCGCVEPPPSGSMKMPYAPNTQVRFREVVTPHSEWGASCAPLSEIKSCVPAV